MLLCQDQVASAVNYKLSGWILGNDNYEERAEWLIESKSQIIESEAWILLLIQAPWIWNVPNNDSPVRGCINMDPFFLHMLLMFSILLYSSYQLSACQNPHQSLHFSMFPSFLEYQTRERAIPCHLLASALVCHCNYSCILAGLLILHAKYVSVEIKNCALKTLLPVNDVRAQC